MQQHDPTPEGSAHILLITAPDCHFCRHAKDVLARVGQVYPLTITELPLSSPEGQAFAAHYGILFPPGLFLGRTFLGFGRVSEHKLRLLLEQHSPDVMAPGPDEI